VAVVVVAADDQYRLVAGEQQRPIQLDDLDRPVTKELVRLLGELAQQPHVLVRVRDDTKPREIV
jgi:hypothetical protein